ncbi:heterogeneous nuclear ribonucleoprotein U-like protein 2 isoform X2 [Sinocyclocheilus anshuiensis]|uniref:heterogeneous nuclear ribonucleoprotein U-like protein 2 isoform X2 n=1 Tax=Sinocyclocheilus anshuiensis TaxID=1608454 RepID=UPI0007BA1AB3|nr:PREDICTED: heterogeneous nuclear ribonucleoprotein U-like protein 2 isoform X2 [Sinocyclocheilus anshuiensis]
MLLAEVKRLKVAELRAMLTERGLDSRGLKAELVVRLISAIEAGVEPIKSADEGRNGSETKSEEPQKTHSPESEQCVRTRSPVCIGPPKKSMTAYTDQSTQTDPLQLCSCTAPIAIAKAAISGEERQQQAYPQHPAANLHPVALATAATEDAESGCSSSVLAISEPEAAQQQEQLLRRLSDGPETVDSTPDESRELKRPVEERGRDYYEFKEDIHYNRAKTPELLPEPEEEAEIDFEDVRLDSYSCDLHFEVDSDGSSGQPLFWETFPLLWSGCRMSHGFCQGKVGFEAKFVKRLSAPALDTSCDPDRHVLRVGWSVDNTSLQLGEVELSYGFDGRGRIVTGAKEEAFGEPFTEGDVIGCYAELPGANRRELMLQQATQCVSQLIRRAAAKRRNYILDQSNIYQSARRHKMLCFHGYQRRAVVVLPPDEVWRRRLVQRQEQEGTALQETSLLKAKVSFTLPELGEHLDQVMFVELSSDEALKLLTHYKEEARHLLPTPPKRKKHRRGSQNSPVHQCGWRGGPFGSHYTSQKAQGRHPSALCRSYGCSSDPQRYRNYYRPYTGQWSSSEQNQSRYGSVYYGCSS